MAIRLDREKLVGRLDSVEYKPETNEEQSHLEQMSLAGVLLALANINHESEYELCRKSALHLLGEVNEPEYIVLD